MAKVEYRCSRCSKTNKFDFTGKPGVGPPTDEERTNNVLSGAMLVAVGFAVLGPLGAALGVGANLLPSNERGQLHRCRHCGVETRIFFDPTVRVEEPDRFPTINCAYCGESFVARTHNPSTRLERSCSRSCYDDLID